MNENKAVDLYTVVIELVPSDISVGLFRVVAEQTVSRKTPEADLTETQLNSLLAHAYGGELAIIDSVKENIMVGDPVRLLATARDPLMLTSEELIRFGFDSDDLA